MTADVTAEVVEEVIVQPPTRKVEGISEALLNELTQGGKEELLYDEVSSVNWWEYIPETNIVCTPSYH